MTRLLLTCLLLAPVAARAADRPVDFNRDVRPILSDKCFACHGPDEKHRAAKLRLDVEKDAKADRDGVPAVVPGKPDESELVARITNPDESERMPPKKANKPLTKAEIETLKRWVAEGARRSAHWAYVPPQKHPFPEVKAAGWPANWIDRFILSRLEHEGLSPSADADRITLARRLYFDLTGLPPTPAEAEAFAKDTDPKAVEKFVDKLLASEHYGERMASYWLDLVRYADTVGYHGDQDHHASPYRDYVIDAFNLNVPFDRFTREQLAGDLVPNSGVDQKIASCYNRLLQTSHEGGVQAKEYLAIYAADRVRNLSAAWMGATVGCAQCHNHKFDPYTQKDFYSLAAFFADVDEDKHLRGAGTDTVPTKRPPEIPVLTRGERERVAQLQEVIDRLQTGLGGAGDENTVNAVAARLADAEEERDRWRKKARLVMVTQSVAPRTMRVLPRGNWMDDSGPEVQPAIPAFLGKVPGDKRATRLDLAHWLTDSKGAGGLTARVFVNRLWYLFFGVGLSKSLEDFGAQGEAPVHPELLDYLAVAFVESGWDVKQMVKLIVTSRAYRQSSVETAPLREKDPENRLYARQSQFRLAAEMVRDNALAVAGLLQLDVGGTSAKPYQPPKYYRHLNFPTREYKADTDAKQWRRGVYVHWQRQYLHPMLKAFDAPTREECTAQRPRSNTPLAALVLLNDPTFIEAARAFAARVLGQGGMADADRVTFAFRETTSRPPDEVERGVLMKLLEKNRARYQADPKSAAEVIRFGLAPVPKDADPVELAAWTAVCRALLNLNETMSRN
ncbi:MAG TPA: PSD1 and planctomycete cytochrome C domain-containing protein [Gemmataceae bacterium]|nr:PSD1 and planctomycete cytochrome C domain-containing protein [Gemmataceae bacterium]